MAIDWIDTTDGPESGRVPAGENRLNVGIRAENGRVAVYVNGTQVDTVYTSTLTAAEPCVPSIVEAYLAKEVADAEQRLADADARLAKWRDTIALTPSPSAAEAAEEA